MAVLRSFRDSTIQENNIVQTIASAAGTLSAIVFVLPGLVMIGWWTGFPYWLSVAVIAIGGILGVMYSVPLRRALVTGTDCPIPRGWRLPRCSRSAPALAERENRRGLLLIVWSSIASALFYMLAQTRLLASEAAKAFGVGSGATAVSGSLSMLLIGVGHLVGLTVGIAMFIGLIISWAFLVPHYTALAGIPAGTDLGDFVNGVFVAKVRFIGAGTIGIAAIWTLLKILGPIISGIRSAMVANAERKAGRGGALPITERDLPIGVVGGTIIVLMIPIGLLLYYFAHESEPDRGQSGGKHRAQHRLHPDRRSRDRRRVRLHGGAYRRIEQPDFGRWHSIRRRHCADPRGLVPARHGGHGEAPCRFRLVRDRRRFRRRHHLEQQPPGPQDRRARRRDPWRQQVALVLGVIFGAIVIPPVLDLLNTAFTFQGAPGAKANALAAPQAALISAIAQGLLNGNFDWKLIEYGAGIGVVVIIIDEVLRKMKRGGLPPLAVGMGIYLPMALTLLVPLGALLGWFYDKWAKRTSNPEFAQRMGVLLATGLIVGESIMGVVYASIVAATQSDAPLALVAENPWAVPLGILIFAVVVLGFYA